MNNSKGMQITDFFVYIGMFFIALFTFSKFENFIISFDIFYLLLTLADICILCGYYGLLKNKKIGLYLTLSGWLGFTIIQSIFITHGIFVSIFSAETFVSIFILCGMIPKLKTLQ